VRRQLVLEGAVVARIMADLKKRPGVVVRKRHGTAMGVAGDPDLYGTIRGRHFEIEVKRPNDPSSQLTKLQTARLLEWNLAGAITGVARSVEDALAILGLKRPATHEDQTVWICSGCHEYRWQSSDAPARCPACGHTRFERDSA
jgi:DNA-directed RNA polymerase subunit RPC12/RpoP